MHSAGDTKGNFILPLHLSQGIISPLHAYSSSKEWPKVSSPVTPPSRPRPLNLSDT